MMKLTLFPYNANARILLQNRNNLVGYDIHSVCSFKEDERLLQQCAREYGVHVETDIIAVLKDTDGVLLVEPTRYTREQTYLPVIKSARLSGKAVLCSRDVFEKLAQLGVPQDAVTLLEKSPACHAEQERIPLTKIPIPVIMVAGMGEDCDKFDVQFHLRRYLNEQGYRVCSICSNAYGVVFGMYSLPPQLFDVHQTYEDRIVAVNQYVYDACISEPSDVLVLGVPGSLSMINSEYPNHFSELPLIVTSAVEADAGIVTFYFDAEYTDDFFEAYRQYCYYKYNIPLACMVLSRKRITYSLESKRLDIYYLDDKRMKQYISDQQIHPALLDLTDEEQRNSGFAACVDMLAENPSTL